MGTQLPTQAHRGDHAALKGHNPPSPDAVASPAPAVLAQPETFDPNNMGDPNIPWSRAWIKNRNDAARYAYETKDCPSAGKIAYDVARVAVAHVPVVGDIAGGIELGAQVVGGIIKGHSAATIGKDIVDDAMSPLNTLKKGFSHACRAPKPM